MNTRLQVEHPVTELVTGVDLVEQMIRVAAGERLTIKQNEVKLNGWAVESRIYAEDPYRNFLPSTGRLVKYRPPAETAADGITIRNDTGVYEGGEISIWYDPMIAKLCSHAPNRTQAIAAMAHALDGFYVDGIRHNVTFLSAIMQNERWQSGELSTGFIEEEFPDGFHGLTLESAAKARLAAVATAIDHGENRRKRRISGQMTGREVRFSAKRVVKLGADWLPVEIAADDGRLVTVSFEGEEALALTVQSAWGPGTPVWEGEIDGQPLAVQVRKIPNGYRLAHAGTELDAYVFTSREAELARLMPETTAVDTSKKLLCPMPGLVVSINVVVDQEVKAGEPLAIVEAMKMQNILRAERDGKVKSIHVKKGDSLAVDAVIMEFA
jgi:propionyl-CoA carboxylase alpha chain